MLKKDYDIFYAKVHNWLFDKYVQFSNDKAYGSIKPFSMDRITVFMQMEVLQFVYNANKLRNPGRILSVPSCIDNNDFNRLISTLKNQII
jgi:hypothetical protein